MGLSTKRICGKDRYEKDALICIELCNSDKTFIAYGKNFPAALAIAPYAAKNDYPILLSETNNPSEATKRQLKGKMKRFSLAEMRS